MTTEMEYFYMKNLILIKRTVKNFAALALLFAASFAFADDGGSKKPEDWTYGNIYVTEPNEKIALEKELLIVEQTRTGYWKDNFVKELGQEVTAIFGFRNTTGERVTVPCAFPVVVSTKVAVRKSGRLSDLLTVGNGVYSSVPVLKVAFQKNLPIEKENYDKTEFGRKEDLFALDKKLVTLSAKDYAAQLSRFGIADSILKPCKIEQDGKNVQILTVGIETSIEKDEELTKEVQNRYDEEHKEDEIYTLNLVLHFYHELVFAPSSPSKLTVNYAIDSLASAHRGTKFKLRYDIYTGGTWKGAMKDFIVLADGEMKAVNSNTKFEIQRLGGLCKGSDELNLYFAKNYKPQKNEYFEFVSVEPFRDSVSPVWNNEKKLDFVKNVRSSSELSGTFKMAGNNDWTGSWAANKDASLRTSTYKAETSFDGIWYNGWVEGVKGDGIGEWIEFTLTKNAIGPFATNGLRRFEGLRYQTSPERGGIWREYDKSDFTTFIKNGRPDSTWKANNRIKAMILSDNSGKTLGKLQFEDLFPEFANDWTANPVAINAVRNPFLLKKGTYRMKIDSVYKGEKWNDTVLGEVWFIPLSDTAAEAIFSDSEGFFEVPITKVVQKYVDEYVTTRYREVQEEPDRFE